MLDDNPDDLPDLPEPLPLPLPDTLPNLPILDLPAVGNTMGRETKGPIRAHACSYFDGKGGTRKVH